MLNNQTCLVDIHFTRQVVDLDLLDKMACYLQGDETLNFVQAETSSNVQLYRKMKEKYPGMTNILVNLVQKMGKLRNQFADLSQQC